MRKKDRAAKKEDKIGGLKPRRRNDYFRFADGFFSSAVFVTLFALFCSARVGYFLLIALFAAPGVSVLLAFISSRFSEVSLSNKKGAGVCLAEKGESISMDVTVRNRSILPTSLIRISVLDTASLEAKEKEINVSVMSKRCKSIPLIFCANLAGGARVGVREAVCEDFFGIARFPVKVTGSIQICGVEPDIPEISAKEPLLEETMRSAFNDDSSDETIDEANATFAGFPGYDYRKYEPGDPLKRINYKLSAKVRELMVRLDERPVTSGVVMILDTAKPVNTDENPIIPGAVQSMLETSLGMVRTLLSRNFSVSVNRILLDNTESSFEIRSEKDLSLLRTDLSFFMLTDNPERIPRKIPGGGSSVICFTLKDDAQLYAILEEKFGGAGSVCIFNAVTGEGRVL